MKFVGEIAVSGMKNDERSPFKRRKSFRYFCLQGGEFGVERRGVRLKKFGVFGGRFAESGGRLFDEKTRDRRTRPDVRVDFRMRTGMRVFRVIVVFRMRMSARIRQKLDVFAKVDGARVRRDRSDVFRETFLDGKTDAEEKTRRRERG